MAWEFKYTVWAGYAKGRNKLILPRRIFVKGHTKAWCRRAIERYTGRKVNQYMFDKYFEETRDRRELDLCEHYAPGTVFEDTEDRNKRKRYRVLDMDRNWRELRERIKK